MTMKTSRVDLKALAASVAIVGALAFAPPVHAQQTGAGGAGQPGGVGQQEGYGQPGHMGQPGSQTGQPGAQIGQPGGQAGQMGQTGQQQERYGQTGQMGQTGQQERYGQTGQMGQTGQQHDRGQQTMQMGQQGAEGKGTQLYVSSESITRVQEALKEHDQDLEVDGHWGPRTSSAVREFQQKQGIEATGKLDIATLQALGVAEQFGFQESDEMDQDRPQRDQGQDQDQQQRQQQ